MKRLFALFLLLCMLPLSAFAADAKDLLHPSDVYPSTLKKLYEPFDYHRAKTSPTSYKNTSVHLSGTVLLYSFGDDGWGYAYLLYDGDGSKTVYITLPPGSIPQDEMDFGIDVEVYGVAYGVTDFGVSYPVILTTMQLVNHGEDGLFPN